ncbi:uncharacterized protein N7482_008594 [Penicillium canariense]|uniref:Only prolin and serin are matching in the corresponding protein n=1 Tax=Penicillium canariense TaxID=189055 RepID=A0A9W9HW38_9EURO|nr:uncharacterized protein N7482_008594 [Penicillium canariense]KAJ5157494.1 hypothetical protein N7482_008594 [Penicillium canariense]
MRILSQIIDAQRESFDVTDSPRLPQSPLAVNTSAPASPAISLFSATGHNRVSSSVSSLVSSSGLGNSMDSPSRSQLTGVQEEPCARDSLEDQYFQHFECGTTTADEPYFPMHPTDSYDLSDCGMDISDSPKKRRSDSLSMMGVSRIGSRVSTVSARWKSKRASGSPERDIFPDDLRSRANSAASSALASPIIANPITRIDSHVPPSPAQTIFEERMSNSGTRPIDITQANSFSQDDNDAPQATTPLLPPLLGDDSMSLVTSRVQSPLQSPSVADVSEAAYYGVTSDPRFATVAGIPSPPLSSKPSVASMSRPRASTVRTISGEPTPFVLSDPNDEWANKLGHANFTIQPEPYVPAICDLESFHQLRADWDMARCNFAKHLVRTGEHYGVTSNIYKLTGEKWECTDHKWRAQHEALLSTLGSVYGVPLSLTQSNLRPCEQVCIPRLHDNAKFPEMGDEDIVGPMAVSPVAEIAGPCRPKSMKKRNFFRFFQDLVGRS